jgi:hypothetical protein
LQAFWAAVRCSGRRSRLRRAAVARQGGAAAGRRQRRADRARALSRRRVVGTVEQLARQHACVGQGAGLVTEPGPVEVYRLQCSDGKVFMARCELRQCRKM